jgi:hypothetical protein
MTSSRKEGARRRFSPSCPLLLTCSWVRDSLRSGSHDFEVVRRVNGSASLDASTLSLSSASIITLERDDDDREPLTLDDDGILRLKDDEDKAPWASVIVSAVEA